MRKVISLVLTFLILVLCSISSMAETTDSEETIDLNKLDNDALIQLYKDIQSEYVNRGIKETIDLSKLDYTDLLQLHQDIQSEYSNRGMEKTARLPVGRYIVGQDIPVGTYKLILKTDDTTGGGVSIYDNNYVKEEDARSHVFSDFLYYNEEKEYLLTLNEGYIITNQFEITLIMTLGVVFQ